MKEDFVSFEIAKKLKEKGFRYNKNDFLDELFMENHPTIFQVLRWLREEKQLLVEPSLFKGGYEPYIQSTVFEENKDYTEVWRLRSFHSTYEEAALAGIEYVLDNLIIKENLL